MKPKKHTYADWVAAVNTTHAAGWQHYQGWIFWSPSGTRHDLSAADLTQLQRIEREGLFRWEPDETPLKCYYLVNCHRDADNYDAYSDHAQRGVWAVKADAQRKVAELNQASKQEWDRQVLDAQLSVAKRQQRWDALHAAGLSEGDRPQFDYWYDREWSPGVGGISYFEVEETEFFPPNASTEGGLRQ
jgi:hypothetical protein